MKNHDPRAGWLRRKPSGHVHRVHGAHQSNRGTVRFECWLFVEPDDTTDEFPPRAKACPSCLRIWDPDHEAGPYPWLDEVKP